MAKITALEEKTFNGKHSGWKVTLDDGRGGNLEEKASDKGLRVGDEVIVTEIPYTSKAGNKSTLYGCKLNTATNISQSQQSGTTPSPQRPQIHVGAGKSAQELKADAAIKATEFMINAFIADKIDWPQIQEKQSYLFGLLASEIDDIFANKK